MNEFNYNDLSVMLVNEEGFTNNNNILTKEIDVQGEKEMILLRLKEDRLIFMNVSKNERYLDQNITDFQTEDFYRKIKDKLDSYTGDLITSTKVVIENKQGNEFEINQPQSEGIELVEINQPQIECVEPVELKKEQTDSRKIEINVFKVTISVRTELKIEGKLGINFAKTANSLELAKGDYIVLTQDFNKKGFFKSFSLSKGTELKVIGYNNKKEVDVINLSNNKNYAIQVKAIHAEYGSQYLKQYHNRPELKAKIDKKLSVSVSTEIKSTTMEELKTVQNNHANVLAKSQKNNIKMK